MNSRRVAKLSLTLAIVMLVVAVAGFIITLVLNAFFLDKYNAYGEVPIPGTGVVDLPAGEATVSLHVLVIGGTNGGGLPVPPLRLSITAPDGGPQPEVTESIGSTTTINNDAHVRVWNVRVPAAGSYNVQTDGQVGGYINPRLAFGHQSSYGYLVWVFVALFVVGLVDLALSIMWLARVRRRPVPAVGQPYFGF
ncbi:SHOCT domain-containing protein [Mycobacterium asiaticum]|uniref:SHOCT domain-containing protein n=1 Tax=Mycobacterium asiaticum TaxID=1790 RepID=UPI000ACE0C09|nr:SHOCT domain-containing protein [Mycobacterium asiaticum]